MSGLDPGGTRPTRPFFIFAIHTYSNHLQTSKKKRKKPPNLNAQLYPTTARRLLQGGIIAYGRVGKGVGNLEAAFDQPRPHALRVVTVAHSAQEAHAIRAIRRDRILVGRGEIQVSAFPSALFTHPSKQSMEINRDGKLTSTDGSGRRS